MAKEGTAEKTAEIKEAAPLDPMKDMVSVMLPRATGREENYIFVALNGKGYTVMRGVQVRLPRPVAEILWEAERNQARQAAYEQRLRDRAGKAAIAAGMA